LISVNSLKRNYHLTNIVQLRPNNVAEEKEQKEFFDNLREQTDSLIYVSKDKDGSFNFGHTPLDSRDLALMVWHLNKVLDSLLTSHAVMGSHDDDEE
jgi:hypothetical protein